MQSAAHPFPVLDPPPEEIRRWGEKTVEAIARYFATMRERAVYPDTSSREIRGHLDRLLPAEGSPFEELLETFWETIVPLSRQNAHSRMFGYVQAPGMAIAAFADLLASTLNANLTAWRSAPAPVEIERLTIDWIKQIVGFPSEAAGILVSGGSMANLSALAVARRQKAHVDFAAKGELQQPLRVYCSLETHYSIEKAAALIGIGRENVRGIAVDGHFRIRLDELREALRKDLDAGYLPCCIVANAGTVMTGAVDPLAQLTEIAREFGAWLHVDACYGGFATLASSARSLFAGIGEADSIALDPHKWLYLPAGCGCILYRNPDAARRTFGQEAEYMRVLGEKTEEAFAFWDYGPELSRPFRALKVWMSLRAAGTRVLGEAVENDLACARHLEKLVQESEDFEMLAPVALSIFCFRHLPMGFRGGSGGADNSTSEQLNAWNERLLLALQRDGSSYLSNARIDNHFVLRGCAMNYRTSPADMEILLDDLRRVAAQLAR